MKESGVGLLVLGFALLVAALPRVAASAALPGNQFQTVVEDLYLSGGDQLVDEVPAAGQVLFLAPGVSVLNVVDQPDVIAWTSDQDFSKDTEVAQSTTATLYFSANLQALAVFRVRLYDLEPDGSKHLLAQDEQQFITALDPTPVDFHLQTAGAVIPAKDVLHIEVQAETTQVAVVLSYGAGTPSGIQDLAWRWLDSDGDGIADTDEVLLRTNPLATDFPETDGIDVDDDGLPDDVEERLGLDPENHDTDGDGYLDGVEFHAGSDPLDHESTPLDEDGDGLPDVFETNYFQTTNINGQQGQPGQGGLPGQPGQSGQPGAPGSPGTDGALDPDGDGCNNLCEAAHGTDPTDPDTDGDGVPDGAEILDGTNPVADVSFASVSGVPEPIAAAAAFAIGTSLVLFPLLRRP